MPQHRTATAITAALPPQNTASSISPARQPAHLATAAVEMVGQFEELLLRILHPPSLPESEEAASHALVDSPMASGMRNLWASRSRRGARGGAAAGEGGDQTGQVRFKPGSKLTTQD